MDAVEIWKDVVGYKGIYQISNLGNVKSLSRLIKTNHKNGRLSKERFLKPDTEKDGYLIVTLSKDNNPKKHKIHRLVAIHFVENPENKPCVNHVFGNKKDNRFWKLEWSTIPENNHHSVVSEFVLKGEKHPNSNLTNNKVLAIRRLYRLKPNLNTKALATKINVSYISVYLILTNRTWRHIL